MPDSNTESSDEQPSLDDLISTREAANISGFSQEHIALLIRKGELWGKKIGRNWVTSEKAIRKYLTRDRRPGPKPRREV